ncbi:MAG: alpha/beta hydrolase domain-containing protein, partial [Steroidobacteraceae bacterium]
LTGIYCGGLPPNSARGGLLLASKAGLILDSASVPPGAQRNTLPLSYVLAQAFLNMYRWVNDGIAPPRTPFIATLANGNPKLDRNGNALGGLRLPELMVPAATYGIAPGACFLLGYKVPFRTMKMKAIYGTKGAYVADLERAAREDVARRLISRAAARAIVAKARTIRPFGDSRRPGT